MKREAKQEIRYSRQREAIWNFLKDRKDHPTADFIYRQIRTEYPSISLGTVYRNLMLLKRLGRLQVIDVGDGTAHFDPNPVMHDHFVCKVCHSVLDIEIPERDAVGENAARHFDGRITGYSAVFYGVCGNCCRQMKKEESNNNNI